MLTEDDARSKWCPMARAVRGLADGNMPLTAGAHNRIDPNGLNAEAFWSAACDCVASECMAWRWSDAEPKPIVDVSAITDDTLLGDLPIPVRAKNAFHESNYAWTGVKTVGEFRKADEMALLRVNGIGPLTIRQIREAIGDVRTDGLRLGFCGAFGRPA